MDSLAQNALTVVLNKETPIIIKTEKTKKRKLEEFLSNNSKNNPIEYQIELLKYYEDSDCIKRQREIIKNGINNSFAKFYLLNKQFEKFQITKINDNLTEYTPKNIELEYKLYSDIEDNYIILSNNYKLDITSKYNHFEIDKQNKEDNNCIFCIINAQFKYTSKNLYLNYISNLTNESNCNKLVKKYEENSNYSYQIEDNNKIQKYINYINDNKDKKSSAICIKYNDILFMYLAFTDQAFTNISNYKLKLLKKDLKYIYKNLNNLIKSDLISNKTLCDIIIYRNFRIINLIWHNEISNNNNYNNILLNKLIQLYEIILSTNKLKNLPFILINLLDIIDPFIFTLKKKSEFIFDASVNRTVKLVKNSKNSLINNLINYYNKLNPHFNKLYNYFEIEILPIWCREVAIKMLITGFIPPEEQIIDICKDIKKINLSDISEEDIYFINIINILIENNWKPKKCLDIWLDTVYIIHKLLYTYE